MEDGKYGIDGNMSSPSNHLSLLFVQLAKLSTLQSRHEDALELLDNAQRIASKHEYRNELRSILCLMGISHASADFNQYSVDLVEKSRAESNY